MFELITLIVIVAAVVYRIDNLNDKAIAAGRTPMSMTNPITWVKVIIGGIGYGVGYTPHAAKRAKEHTQLAIAESRREMQVAGLESEVQFKTNKVAGSHTGYRHHHRASTAAANRRIRIERDIAAVQARMDAAKA